MIIRPPYIAVLAALYGLCAFILVCNIALDIVLSPWVCTELCCALLNSQGIFNSVPLVP
jgi:hypothetical protein